MAFWLHSPSKYMIINHCFAVGSTWHCVLGYHRFITRKYGYIAVFNKLCLLGRSWLGKWSHGHEGHGTGEMSSAFLSVHFVLILILDHFLDPYQYSFSPVHSIEPALQWLPSAMDKFWVSLLILLSLSYITLSSLQATEKYKITIQCWFVGSDKACDVDLLWLCISFWEVSDDGDG